MYNMIKLAAVQNSLQCSAGASQIHCHLSNASHQKKFEKVVMHIGILALSFDAILVIRYLSFSQLIRKACIQFILRTT